MFVCFCFFFVIFTTTFLLVHVLETFLLLSLLRFFLRFLFCVFLEKKRGDRNAARDVSCFQSVSRAVPPSGCSSSHRLLFKLPSSLAAVVSLPVRCSSPSLPAVSSSVDFTSFPLQFGMTRNEHHSSSLRACSIYAHSNISLTLPANNVVCLVSDAHR